MFVPPQRAQSSEREKPLSIPEVAALVNKTLGALAGTRFKGEVMGVHKAEKVTRFTVKDEGGKIEAKIFNSQLSRTKAIPEEGKTFIFTVEKFDFYAPYAFFSVLVSDIEYDAEGELRRQYQELRTKLEMEGAFDPRRRRPLPWLPRSVGVITSTVGKVQEDIKRMVWERYPTMTIRLYAAKVQGGASATSIVGAFERVRREAIVDVVILARGGGSFEELFSFNTESVVRAVMACPVPVVSAIGHGPDVFLTDLVADATEMTPTAAAVRVVPVKAEMVRALHDWAGKLRRESQRELVRRREHLAGLRHRLDLFGPERLFKSERERLYRHRSFLLSNALALIGNRRARLQMMDPATQIDRRIAAQIRARRGRLRECEAALDRHDLRKLIPERQRELAERGQRLDRIATGLLRARLEVFSSRRTDFERALTEVAAARRWDLDRLRVPEILDRLIRGRIAQERARTVSLGDQLRSLDPTDVLGRGYSITRDADSGQVLRSADDTVKGRHLKVMLAKGTLGALVEETNS